ncbi:MotA/TolQ/ExbB proton channel family protein [Flavivirga eckloniae]|uniref:MotA/TolQ/ExbB proton channel domain-containing protein n=1 Tax=Flavivirga eckloniae TaxID=1803846 RepID=A0A2K9PTT4_9FLAO|nr:MotA/TolQ/ExbB proton channel family protein [Flavivirga eckloniae]AUP79967.1 hypothetical protein C1H87_15155 [Flavivirga eckloniae]
MIDFIKNGGLIFTLPLTLMLLINIVMVARSASFLFANKFSSKKAAKKEIDYIRYLGVFALAFGLFGQIIALYEAFESIENWGNVDSDLLFAGFKVSTITTLYGLGIFILSYLSWLLLKIKLNALNIKTK